MKLDQVGQWILTTYLFAYWIQQFEKMAPIMKSLAFNTAYLHTNNFLVEKEAWASGSEGKPGFIFWKP